MKYPTKQYTLLVQYLKELSKLIDLTTMHPNNIHYLIYQQGSENQTYNHLYSVGGTIKRQYQLTDDERGVAVKAFNFENGFELYPDGCDDTHIGTAVKRALKVIGAQ